jgi:hypothetical protein
MTRDRKGGVSFLLMLSAIDMLTASLVCAIVLFVVLVGSDAASQRVTPSTGMATAPSLIEAISPADSAGISMVGLVGALQSDVAPFDDFVKLIVAAGKWKLQRFRLPPGEHRLQVAQAPQSAALIIHSVKGARKIVAIRCAKYEPRITLTFEPELTFQSSCPPSPDARGIAVPAGTQLVGVFSGPVARMGDWTTKNARRLDGEADELTIITTKDVSLGDRIPLMGFLR